MSNLRMLYAALAIWGAAHPAALVLRWLAVEGWSFSGLIAAWHANLATMALMWDLIIAAVALTVWICAEIWARRNWVALWAIPASWLLGVGCGLPLYLFLRTRPED